jgi:hypothetical protein
VLYLVGSTMDWVEDDFTAGFTFANPNAKACGCGESFEVLRVLPPAGQGRYTLGNPEPVGVARLRR